MGVNHVSLERAGGGGQERLHNVSCALANIVLLVRGNSGSPRMLLDIVPKDWGDVLIVQYDKS